MSSSKASSFLPRLSLSRGDGPSLPLFSTSRRPLRTQPSEYDLDELSPRPEDSLLWPEPGPDTKVAHSQAPPPPANMKRQVLFAGPPPPIATSTLLYKDEEAAAAGESTSRFGTRSGHSASLGDTIRSVFLDRPPADLPRDKMSSFDPDSVWRSLQRRERAIQKDLQRLLDVQAEGLSAGLGHGSEKSPSLTPSSASDAGRSTPTSLYHTPRSQFQSADSSMRMSRQAEVIPVRQPKVKPMGLRGARSALARNMALLADLKAEEDANLADALSSRKRALAQLRKMSARRDVITQELQTLENAEHNPLTKELSHLKEEHKEVSTEISELEAQLAGLRNRKKVLEEAIDDTNNRRESSFSGYRGALREVEEHVAAVLNRPPVRPLDLEALNTNEGSGSSVTDGGLDVSLSGAEFLRLRPTRRTTAMAREWWEGEVKVLERRIASVGQDKAALEEGTEVWLECVRLVTDFESSLRRQMKQEDTASGDDTDEHVETPEERMRAQLGKMEAVIKDLEQHLATAERKGWNLLICAVGAELEAFKEAEEMFRGALRESGFPVPADEEDRTPRLGRSTSEVRPPDDGDEHDKGQQQQQSLLDADADAESSDNEVPPDLLVSHHDERRGSASTSTTDKGGDSSENEVPQEFLAEHRDDD